DGSATDRDYPRLVDVSVVRRLREWRQLNRRHAIGGVERPIGMLAGWSCGSDNSSARHQQLAAYSIVGRKEGSPAGIRDLEVILSVFQPPVFQVLGTAAQVHVRGVSVLRVPVDDSGGFVGGIDGA